MKSKKNFVLLLLFLAIALPNLAMGRHGQYDEEARAAEREAKKQQKENSQSVEEKLAEEGEEVTLEEKPRSYKVEEPAKGTEDTTKISFKIPGT